MSGPATSMESWWDDGVPEAEEAEEEEAVGRAARRPEPVNNEAALLLKLRQMRDGASDDDDDDEAWLETLAVTAPEALGVDDAEDELKREVAFYNQALDGVRAANARLGRLGIPKVLRQQRFGAWRS